MAKKIFEIDKDSVVKGTGNGYMYCTTTPEHPFGEKRKDRKKKYIYYHRALLEHKLNRFLKPNEQADHKDGDKTNNTPGNLEIKMLGDHQKTHTTERGNSFWKKSPRNKPGRKAVLRVLTKYAEIDLNIQKMTKVTPKGWPSNRWVPVCGSCLEGKHLSYGMDHMPKTKLNDDEDLSRYGCKNVGKIDGKEVQCGCNAEFDELLEVLKKKKAACRVVAAFFNKK